MIKVVLVGDSDRRDGRGGEDGVGILRSFNSPTLR